MQKTGTLLVKNSLFLIGCRLISRMLQFFLFIYAARVLGVEKFGIFSYAFAFTALVTVFMDLGISRYVIQQASRDMGSIHRFMGASFVIKSILIVLGLIFIALVGPFFQKGEKNIYVFAILGGVVALDNLTLVFSSVFQADERMDYQSVIILVANTLMAGAGFLLVYFYPDLIVYCLVFLSGAVLRFVLSLGWCVRKYGTPVMVYDVRVLTDLVKKGFPFALTTIFVSIYYYIDTFLLNLSSGEEIVGYYNASYRLIEAPLFISAVLTTVLFPAASRLYSQGNRELRFMVQKVFPISAAFGLIISVAAAFFSEEVIMLVYGSQYEKSVLVFPILILSTAAVMPNAVIGTVLRAIDKQAASAMITGAGAIINVLANLIVIPAYSFVGAAWTTLGTEVFILVVSLVLVQRYMKGLFNSLLFVKMAIFAFCITAFLYSSTAAGMILQLIAYSLISPLILLLMKFIDWKDVRRGLDRFAGHGETAS